MKKYFVTDRIAFAQRRLEDLLALSIDDLIAKKSERQQLLQEFLFHLVGAIEVLVQLANEMRQLNIHSEDVSIERVCRKLAQSDPIKAKLRTLYAPTRKKPLPKDPYSDEGYIFRIYNYRNQVTHRSTNTFLISIGPRRSSVQLYLDPRDLNKGYSNKSFQDELRYMFDLIRTRCKQILLLL